MKVRESLLPDRVHELEREIQLLKTENDRLARFLEISRLFNLEKRIDHLVPLIMSETSRLLNADRSTLFLIDLDNQELWSKYAEGINDRRIHIELKLGIVGVCVITGQLINVKDAYGAAHFYRAIDESSGYRTQSILCSPFFDQRGEVLGALQLLNKKTGVFTEEDEIRIQETCALITRMAQSRDLGRAHLKNVISRLRRATESDRGSLFLIDREHKRLCSVVAEGVQGPGISLNLNLGIAGFVAITGQELNIRDAYSDSRFDKETDRRTGYLTRSILCVPIRNQAEEILGVIQVINKRSGTFTDSDLELLKVLSTQIAIPLENAILFDEQNQQFESVLKVLAASIDAKDPLTAGHSQKVAEYATAIARELGFGEAELDVVNVAALLHDYGKIGVNDNILKKPGRLTPLEFEEIKQHVTYTTEILSKMRFMRKYRNIPFIASCHHERLDGSGYSAGLKSHEIPFMSKILAVADVFEALTATRHYRGALSADSAFTILEEGIESRFDKQIVEGLKRYWKERCSR
jgi:putative nucleotidyltransferase with HDIG domain